MPDWSKNHSEVDQRASWGDSGGKPGWYTADVQGYDDINDEISLIYPGEPDFVYKMDVESSVTEKSIRIVRPCI